MSKKRLFEYAVILHTKNEKGETINSELIIPPTATLAASEKDVTFTVIREIPEEHAKNSDNVEILVRAF